MSLKTKDFLFPREQLEVPGLGSLKYLSFEGLSRAGFGEASRLPFTLRVVLETVARNCDGFAVTEEHVRSLLSWKPKVAGSRSEIPYKPARVVLQDFTGVPSLVDLAAMRDALAELGGDAERINPLVPCDLVIDHSVQVDFFGTSTSLEKNEKREFERNAERYAFLKWGQQAFKNFRVVPPSAGIVHQVNLEYLSQGVFYNLKTGEVYPDSCVGTDSHTPMVNGLGVLAWGVGGIEAEAVMLDQAIYMLIPDVVGIKLTGELPPGVTATDLVLKITELCRKQGVVGKFVEFFGSGVSNLSVPDRATISNMAPEQGATVSFFPIDDAALSYLRTTGRSQEAVALTERYCKEQGLFLSENSEVEYSERIEVDLSQIEPAVAGPKRPHDWISLGELGARYQEMLTGPSGPRSLGLPREELSKTAQLDWADGEPETLRHGSVVIAAITSCTNTSNPSVMLAAGLLAKKAVERGLRVKRYVKTSLAPGSRVVTAYLETAGVLPYLEKLGFNVVGYGCTTCIGNSGPLIPEVAFAIEQQGLVVSSVLSGNRNFEGRVHPLTKTNFLASPPLVVAYALFGTTARDISRESLGLDSEGQEVFLKDIWPSKKEINDAIEQSFLARHFLASYKEVFEGSRAWKEIPTTSSKLYPWNPDSTYIQKPPFFEGISQGDSQIQSISQARALAVFGDSVTTDHISPAGNISLNSPAARYLESRGVAAKDFNSYGSRRGNDKVMSRGTFANIRISNKLVPEREGNWTIHLPSRKELSFFDAAALYQAEGVPLIVLAGKEYGSGSSRDWAAKGPFLQGVRAVIAQSYERIHRSNLIGMGILPLEFEDGDSVETLGLSGKEIFSIPLSNDLKPGAKITVNYSAEDGSSGSFEVRSRIDTPVEIEYYRDGGILRTVLKKFAKE